MVGHSVLLRINKCNGVLISHSSSLTFYIHMVRHNKTHYIKTRWKKIPCSVSRIQHHVDPRYCELCTFPSFLFRESLYSSSYTFSSVTHTNSSLPLPYYPRIVIPESTSAVYVHIFKVFHLYTLRQFLIRREKLTGNAILRCKLTVLPTFKCTPSPDIRASDAKVYKLTH